MQGGERPGVQKTNNNANCTVPYFLSTKYLNQMKETVPAIAWQVEKQNREEFPLPLYVICFKGRQERFRLVEVQQKQGICENGTGFRNTEQTNERAESKTKISLITDREDFPHQSKGFPIGIREIDDVFVVAVAIFDFFFCVRIRRL